MLDTVKRLNSHPPSPSQFRLVCYSCPWSCPDLDDMDRHCSVNHVAEDNNDPRLRCEACNVGPIDAARLRLHCFSRRHLVSTDVHGDRQDDDEDAADSEEEDYCNVCGGSVSIQAIAQVLSVSH